MHTHSFSFVLDIWLYFWVFFPVFRRKVCSEREGHFSLKGNRVTNGFEIFSDLKLKTNKHHQQNVSDIVIIDLISALIFMSSAQLKLHQDLQIDVRVEVSIPRQALSLLQLWLPVKKTSLCLTLGLSAQVIMILKFAVPYPVLILPSVPLVAVK